MAVRPSRISSARAHFQPTAPAAPARQTAQHDARQGRSHHHSQSQTSSYFLGIELSEKQIRAAIVDESLATIGVEVVDFESDVPEMSQHRTRTFLPYAILTPVLFTTSRAARNNLHTPQSQDATDASMEVWVRALDRVFEKLRSRFDLSKIKVVGGSAYLTTVWWKNGANRSLARLSASSSLFDQMQKCFSVPQVPILPETSLQSQSLVLEASNNSHASGHTLAHLSLPAAQIVHVRERQNDMSDSGSAWRDSERIHLASSFLATVLCGKYCPMTDSELASTGLWDCAGFAWEDGVLDLLAGGSSVEGERLSTLLGEVVRSGSQSLGNVSSYFVDRYGLSSDAYIVPFTSGHLASYMSVCPEPSEIVLCFGSSDVLMTPARKYRASQYYVLHPHPAQNLTEKKRYIAMLVNRNADKPRQTVRDLYTKNWSAFDRLISVVPPGGSIGLDDKLFSFWVLNGENFPFALVKGIFRFETGIKVTEFRDLRTNPRSLIESQILSFRVRYARMMASGLLPRRKVSQSPSMPRAATPLGLSFDPYDQSRLPKRIIAMGSAANFPSVVSLIGDIFNTPVFVPLSDSSVANAGPRPGPATDSSPPGRTMPYGGGPRSIAVTVSAEANIAAKEANLPMGSVPAPSRASAALGAAYFACWAYRRRMASLPTPDGTIPIANDLTYEEEIRELLREGHGERKNAAAAAISSAVGGHLHGVSLRRPGSAGISTVHERDEDDDTSSDDEEESNRPGGPTSSWHSDLSRSNPSISNTTNSGVSAQGSPFTDMSSSHSGLQSSVPSIKNLSLAMTPSLPLAAQPQVASIGVTALPTEMQDVGAGLVKVADCDADAFLLYASLVPEYCRLEGMLVRALVQ